MEVLSCGLKEDGEVGTNITKSYSLHYTERHYGVSADVGPEN